MNPKNPTHRKAAAKMSIVVENALSAAHAQSRFVDSIGTSRFAGKYADFIMRASGLSPHTQAGRSAFGMTVYGELADNAQKSFKDMDQDFARMLTRYGIDADGWDILRSADLMDHAGHQYMTPADVAGINHPRAVELATKLKQAVFSEMNFAVPTGTARVEGLLSFGTDKGTLVGELTRTFMMYKRFPVLVMQSHLTRSLFSPEGSWVSKDGKFNRGVYIAKLTIYTSVMGALAVQLSDISNGKDPRDMTDPKFWGAAVLKGGAMGFFGDFMYSGLYGQNRYGQSMLGSMAGPGASFVGDTLKLTLGQLGAASIGEDANFGRAATDYFERYLMPGTSLWYSKLAQDRLIADQLKKAADPKYNKRIRMIENRALKERGQKYWWKAGDVAPERTPDLKKAGGS
ncbi:hypothetical protein COB52_00090 [Candidatus Kaiserbacteria bacterium]|nr:MAG: hypothetical protein COB52_00090 [Candidatus Kaiserbacteria bacterium]